ncbi:MAG: hypothetical protein DMG21_15685 [Acidobacteria bacterium]|nr:MAG: hypothetical protein DMG21_15685 [Acidobacteriota bacterium]
MDTSRQTANPIQPPRISKSLESVEAAREPDGLYQKRALVARVADAEIDTEAREVRMNEVYLSDTLVIPEECEYGDYRIQIQRIEFASKIDRAAPEKGRVLRGVTADILGTREP